MWHLNYFDIFLEKAVKKVVKKSRGI